MRAAGPARRAPIPQVPAFPTTAPCPPPCLQLVFRSEVSELGGLGPVKNWLALAILMLVLVGIASERIHRMWCAMIGAALMVGGLGWGGVGCGRTQAGGEGGACRSIVPCAGRTHADVCVRSCAVGPA